MPKRSKASRSNQFATDQMSATESTIGWLPPAYTLSLSRRLYSTDSRWYTTAKRRGSSSASSTSRSTPRPKPVLEASSVSHSDLP